MGPIRVVVVVSGSERELNLAEISEPGNVFGLITVWSDILLVWGFFLPLTALSSLLVIWATTVAQRTFIDLHGVQWEDDGSAIPRRYLFVSLICSWLMAVAHARSNKVSQWVL